MKYESARQMVFEAYLYQGGSLMAQAIEKARVGADVQLTNYRPVDGRICHGLEAGQVISRVESLPAFLQSLLVVLFGPFTADELDADREWVQLSLFRALIESGVRPPARGKGNQVPSVEQLEAMRALCHAALYHHAETTWPYNRPGLPTVRSVKRCLWEEFELELDASNWSRQDRPSWGRVWRSALTCLQEWEGTALAPVAELLREHKEARREGRAVSQG
ncbi:hypothetical protein [Halomonas sp. NO4]|uniref:hypothetical protein n=1 Tax=Halomonas sp. NO4 TaxID=2484813 RepID=UPI0013D5DABC|nr:hypothetical protein [Halomonas sp. NO4]